MSSQQRKRYVERFADHTNAARERGEVREADPDLRVFLFGPVNLDTIQWVSEREGMEAVSEVQRDGERWMTVMIP